MTGIKVPHNGVGADASLLDKEIKRGDRTHGPRTCRLDKQTPQAQIPNLGDFVTSIIAPKDPDALRRLHSRVKPS